MIEEVIEAVLYDRFSTEAQSGGHSERRQLDFARRICREKGWVLNETLRFHDVGSGYKGDKQKALADFLDSAKAGRLERVKRLIVEDTDRLTRKGPWRVLTLLREITDLGINVYVKDREYTAENFEELASLFPLILGGDVGKSESGKKSERLAAKWSDRREQSTQGTKVASRGPAWLKRVNGGWVPTRRQSLPSRCCSTCTRTTTACRISVSSSTRGDYWKPPSSRWTKSYAETILKDRRVIGELQWKQKVDGKRSVPVGDPIPNYFPVILDLDQYHRVQAMRAVRGKLGDRGGGRSGGNYNIFRRMAKCAVCRVPMHLVNHGRGRHSYLQCKRVIDGIGCENNKPIRYDKVKPILLYHARGIDARAMLLDDSQKADAVAERRRLQGLIKELKTEMNSIEDSLFRPKNASIKDRFEARLRDRQAERERLEQQLQLIVVKPDLKQIEEELRSIEDLLVREEALKGPEGKSFRGRLNSHLYQLIEYITIKVNEKSVIHIKFRHSGRLSIVINSETYEVVVKRTRFPDDPVDIVPELGQDVAETLARRGLNPHTTVPSP